MGSILYRGDDRFYLVPDDVELPAGLLTIRALSGDARAVDPVAAAPYRVTEAVARKLAAAELRTVAGRLDQTLDSAGRMLSQLTRDEGSALESLHAHLEKLTEALKTVDLATPAGVGAIDRLMAELAVVDDKAALERVKGEGYQSLAEQLAELAEPAEGDP